ncbi:MAG: hypothetical protein QOF53_1927 [Nocardioidaceae bacterium]|nr:hypothetical protein [Nocardioidaceae bacterium]
MERASFADVLRHLRESRSLTQEELAERAGVTVKAVGALERGERLRPYPHTVRSLADALELREAERARLVASVPSRGSGTVTDAGSAASTSSFPASTFSFPAPILGRTWEIDLVSGLLREPGRHVVTLTGPGGVGKTRLALEVASRMTADFPAGVTVVGLAAVRDPGTVLAHIAAALGVPESASDGTVARLAPYLLGRRVLLVLDNLEQVLRCAPVVAELVSFCPDLVVLATSRAALRIRAEREVVLAPLNVPDQGVTDLDEVAASSAVALFRDRAEAAGATIEWTDRNAAAVAAICRRLDGLPLALELGAAQARLLTPPALLARLDERRRESGPRDLPDRQRTITAALDWSHDLLELDEQRLFARLAVFTGGFSLASVEAVTDEDVLPSLGALVEQSLVLRTEAEDEPRFRLLEPVRQYAAERSQSSGVATATADRHASHFHDVATSARGAQRGPDIVETIDRLETDHANLRSAYLRLIETDRFDEAAELAGSLWLYLGLRGHAREGLTWLDRLDENALGDAARCQARIGRAGLLFVTGEIAPMRGYAEEALALARNVGPESLRSEAAILAGHAAVFTADVEEAGRLLDEGLAAADSAGDPWAHAHALVGRGQLALTIGDLAAADAALTSAVSAARALGNAFTLATSLTRLATVTGLRGDDRATADLLGESTDLSVAARMSWTLSYSLPALAGVAVRLGHADNAARLFGAAASLSATHAVDPRFPVSAALTASDLTMVREQLGEEHFRRAWDAGRTAARDEIAELARAIRRLARG